MFICAGLCVDTVRLPVCDGWFYPYAQPSSKQKMVLNDINQQDVRTGDYAIFFRAILVFHIQLGFPAVAQVRGSSRGGTSAIARGLRITLGPCLTL